METAMTGSGKLGRSRWAAIGAAVAVTLGAGGLYTARADSSPSAFVAISPVRVLDTRLPGFGGSILANSPRNLQVTGTIPTVGADGRTVTNAQVVPVGATAIVANVTAVFPTTGGFVSVRPATASGSPTTSNINFTAGGVVVPNAVTVEIPTTGGAAGQVQLWFGGPAGASTDLLVDIVGYYQVGAAGPQGPAGPVGATGSTGPAGPPGANGVAPWGTIPSGVTVTGFVAHDTTVPEGIAVDGFAVTLPAAAPVELSSGNIQFGASAPPQTVQDADARCNGTKANPTAPPGVVCIYDDGLAGVELVSGDAPPYEKDRAFLITYSVNQPDVLIYAVWAYTAP
jgi:hypothetical protein